MYHVFVVDENTFEYHLKYQFAGTGAQDKCSPFLTDADTNSIHSTTERNLVGMIADVSKIRVGDKIIFYLQSTVNREGMFYGVFKATSKAFFDENDQDNYLVNELRKGLSFRITIEPDVVFPLGITEHEFLDSLNGKSYPHQMCWSLIYRKLKGNRGCTMITDYEFSDLFGKLKKKNNGNYLDSTNFSFISNTDSIVASAVSNDYVGRKNSLDISTRMIYKANRNNAFECHLQAYLLQNYDIEPLKDLLLPKPQLSCWIGNEVSCGVGMQRIDIMIKQETDTDVYIKIIELKCTEPYVGILETQIPWYIEWVNDYVVPNYQSSNKQIHIIPCIVAQRTNSGSFLEQARTFMYNTRQINTVLEPLEYISFIISNNRIVFNKVI